MDIDAAEAQQPTAKLVGVVERLMAPLAGEIRQVERESPVVVGTVVAGRLECIRPAQWTTGATVE
jgi:hypothetical protein